MDKNFQVRARFLRDERFSNRRDNPPWLSFFRMNTTRTGAGVCAYGTQSPRPLILRYGACAPTQDEALWPSTPPPGFRFWPSFRRKPESIFAFAFSPPRSDVFTPGRGESESNTKTKGEFSEFCIWTPRNNKVVPPAGEKSKWIPAFAGMTAVVSSDQG